MDQYNSLKILRLIVVMTHGYLKCCNVSLLIYRGFMLDCFLFNLVRMCKYNVPILQ